MVEFEYEELVKATENFSPSGIIGRGSHGWIFKGKLKNGRLVAVKKPLHDCHEALYDDKYSKLENEIRVLSYLSKTQNSHPCIVGFLGSSHDPDGKNKKQQLLVMELMPNGSLDGLLHDKTRTTPPPSWPKRVEIASQVARAVQSLHERRPYWVIHRDIKSANVLFDSNWDAKLADFGLAVLAEETTTASQPAGTIGYLDPGYTTPTKLSTKNDVYSFGVVLLEIISGSKAMDVGRAPVSISEWAVGLIKQGKMEEICDARIPLPAHMVATIRHLLIVAASCVSIKEDCRPSIGEIVFLLGMDSCYFEPGIRNPLLCSSWSWTGLLRRFVLTRTRRKLAKTLRNYKISAIGNNF